MLDKKEYELKDLPAAGQLITGSCYVTTKDVRSIDIDFSQSFLLLQSGADWWRRKSGIGGHQDEKCLCGEAPDPHTAVIIFR
ncbi:MAG: hypothetical protein ABI759_05035 [Candidatus Solibacter sp.]